MTADQRRVTELVTSLYNTFEGDRYFACTIKPHHCEPGVLVVLRYESFKQPIYIEHDATGERVVFLMRRVIGRLVEVVTGVTL